MTLKEKYPDWKDPCEHDWQPPNNGRWVRIIASLVLFLYFLIQLIKN